MRVAVSGLGAALDMKLLKGSDSMRLRVIHSF
jgi:hypothetical protein